MNQNFPDSMSTTKKDSRLTGQLELEFNGNNAQEKKKKEAKIIDLRHYTKKVLTAQALKTTKSF